MTQIIIDTVVLRVMSFAHPQGIEILLDAINVSCGRFPTEVYNRDEDSLPLEANDEELSELARGLRYAQRRIQQLPPTESRRFQTWLKNAEQLDQHFHRGNLVVEILTVEELYKREMLQTNYPQLGKGETACLVLAQRYQVQAVFLSSDDKACEVAKALKIPHLTLPDILEAWVQTKKPLQEELNTLTEGMANAQFRLKRSFVEQLRQQL
jgi:predicted nucleic acid-binding protein